MRATNIINGEVFPADWRVSLSAKGVCTVETPVATYEFSHFIDAVLYRDFIVTRSKSVDRDKRGARG